MVKKTYPRTPDGRYFLAKGRLWRCTNPDLPDSERRQWVKRLMQARLAVRNAEDEDAMRAARTDVQTAKVALGERGPIWWSDDAPDVNGYHPKNTAYAHWWCELSEEEREAGGAPFSKA